MFPQQALSPLMPRLRKFALRLTHNMSEADDLLQATLLRALEKNETFLEGSNLIGWTSKIMFNIFVSQYRHKRKFASKFDPAPYIDKIEAAPGQETAVDLSIVLQAMKRLDPGHREVLFLVCVKDLSYKEVAERLAIPVGTVRSRLSRARQQMRDALEPQPGGIDLAKASAAYASAQKMLGANLH